MSEPRNVLKSGGQYERFSPRKLYRSLRASGAGKEVAQRVIDAVESAEDETLSTREIEQLALRILEEESSHLAARYSLKKALFDLGPTGYPFEKWVAALLEAEGFRTEVGVVLPGRCISHEVDVIARRNGRTDFVECKFRSSAGLRCDAKIALYVSARARDLHESAQCDKFDRFRLVTNTKFTGDAIQFAECIGLDLLGWAYPQDGGIARCIEEYKLHPVTCLSTLAPEQRFALVEKGVLLCRELAKDPNRLEAVGVDPSGRVRVLEEIEALLEE